MNDDLIGYSKLIDDALRSVVREALRLIVSNGLPGEHHCYITFLTNHPGVEIADTLMEKYPEEMTIVLQHQYWDLKVEEKYFSIGLSFNKKREKLVIPFNAITAYVDPSIKFGLQLQPHSEESMVKKKLEQLELSETDDTPKKSADIISLDSFRKSKT